MEDKVRLPSVMRSITGTWLGVVALITLSLALTSLGVLLWWTRPVAVIEITKPTQTIGTVFRTGDYMEFTFHYCKHLDLSAELHYYWTDSVVFSSPTATLHRLIIGCHSITEGVEVPNIPPGTYHLDTVRIYHPSPLREVEVRDTSNNFQVVK